MTHKQRKQYAVHLALLGKVVTMNSQMQIILGGFRTFSGVLLAVLGLTVTSLIVSGIDRAHAQTSTAELHQFAKSLTAELELLRKADFNPPVRWQPNEMRAERQARHVFAKARTVLEKIRMLQAINAQAAAPIEPAKPGEKSADEVKTILEQAIADARVLRKLYGVQTDPAASARADGKTMSDVYDELMAADTIVTSIGIPEIGHYDVMRLLLGLRDDMKSICDRRNAGGCASVGEPTQAELPKVMQPRDIFDRSYQALSRFKTMVDATPAMSVAGGVTVPPMPQRPPVPNDVMSLVGGLLAETSAVKAKLGIDKLTHYPERQELIGRSPQWCYFYLGQSLALLEEINKKSASN